MEQSKSFNMQDATKLFTQHFKFKQGAQNAKKGTKRTYWSDNNAAPASQSQSQSQGGSEGAEDEEPAAKAAKVEEDDGEFNLEEATEEIVLTSVNTTADFLKLFAKNKSKAVTQMQEQIVLFVKAGDEAKGLKNLLQVKCFLARALFFDNVLCVYSLPK